SMSNPFRPLRDKVFLRLYLSQTISLLGDAFTWVGIALLAFQLGGQRSAAILAMALTLRVTAFIIFGPYAGALADRVDRRKMMYITHFVRMAIVACLPFVTKEWQIYSLIFFLNIFNAFFTPAYKAAIPQSITHKEDYGPGISLSNATNQLLGVLGPGLAGGIAAWLGAREIFFVDAASFIIAAVIILSLPPLIMKRNASAEVVQTTIWKDILKGTTLLFHNKAVRFALLIELVSAIAGAQILVNTVGYIKGQLHLTDKHYGYVMAAFGIGAAIAAFASGNLDKSKNRIASLMAGAVLVCLSIAFGNYVSIFPLLILWLLAGFGQTLAEMPSQILIAEKIEKEEHGKVYGAHFAWSHLWWAIGYPIAGFTGTYYRANEFLIGAGISVALFILITILFYPKNSYIKNTPPGITTKTALPT
ncbi:MAG TPA: MFS transporter, partial [Flavisolibacter sp.]|nr:MFS transporter [Flavisolibacter sp.]